MTTNARPLARPSRPEHSKASGADDRTGAQAATQVTRRPDTGGEADGRLRRLIGGGLLLLVAVMPFHAFLSVWLGSLTGQQMLIQAWKEVVTLTLAIMTGVLLWRRPGIRAALRTPLTWWAAGFVAVGLVVTAVTRPALVGIAYGLKTDYEFIVLLFIALVAGTARVRQLATSITVVTGVIVAGFGVIHSYLLPADVLTAVGYGPNTIWAYHLVDPALSVIRSPSTLGGPNQLGAFLIVPFALVLARAVRRPRAMHAFALAVMAGGIWVSYSRAAFLGALTAAAIVVFMRLSLKQAVIGAVIVMAGLAAGTAAVLHASSTGHDLQYYVFHSEAGSTDANNSTNQHALALLHSIEAVIDRPLGDGLGTAGPASLRTDVKFIPENFYFQIAIETGLLGLAAFVGFLATAGWRLLAFRHVAEPAALLAALAGVSVVNLFLHGWAVSTLAFVFWILAGLWLAPQAMGSTPAATRGKRGRDSA